MQLKKTNRRRGRRKEHVMCGFCTEYQSNCEIYAISSTILFPLILNVFCTGYSCVVYFYMKKDYSFSIIYLSNYILFTKIFAFYSPLSTQIFLHGNVGDVDLSTVDPKSISNTISKNPTYVWVMLAELH